MQEKHRNCIKNKTFVANWKTSSRNLRQNALKQNPSKKMKVKQKARKTLKKATDPQIIWVLGHKSFSNIAVNLRKISIETSWSLRSCHALRGLHSGDPVFRMATWTRRQRFVQLLRSGHLAMNDIGKAVNISFLSQPASLIKRVESRMKRRSIKMSELNQDEKMLWPSWSTKVAARRRWLWWCLRSTT